MRTYLLSICLLLSIALSSQSAIPKAPDIDHQPIGTHISLNEAGELVWMDSTGTVVSTIDNLNEGNSLSTVSLSEAPVMRASVGDDTTSIGDLIDVISDIKNVSTWEELLGMQGAILALLMLVLPYLGKYIPLINRIPKTRYMVLAIAIVIILVFALFGFKAAVIKGVVTYIFTSSVYELFLNPMIPTPKTKVQLANTKAQVAKGG